MLDTRCWNTKCWILGDRILYLVLSARILGGGAGYWVLDRVGILGTGC